MRFLAIGGVLLLSVTVAGCVTVREKTDEKTGIKVQTVGIVGCGSPSQRITYVTVPGRKTDSYASTGGDPCNTLIGAAGQVAASAVLPGSNLNVSSGTLATLNSNVQIRN